MQMRDIVARLDDAAQLRAPLLDTVPAAGEDLLETIVWGRDVDMARELLRDRVNVAARAVAIHKRDGFQDLANHAAMWGLWFGAVEAHLHRARQDRRRWDTGDRWIGPR